MHGTKAELRFALNMQHRKEEKLIYLHTEIKVLVDRKGVEEAHCARCSIKIPKEAKD